MFLLKYYTFQMEKLVFLNLLMYFLIQLIQHQNQINL